MDQTATSTRFLGGSKKFYLNVAIMLCIEIFFRFIPPFGEMTAMGMAVLGVFLGTVYGWLTLDSMPVASLLGVLMMVNTSFYSTANEAFSASFGGTLCLQLIMIFGLVGVLNDANCTELYVRKILNSKLGKRSIWMMLFLFFLCQYILGFFGSWALTLLLLALWREVCKVTGAERGLLTFGISTIILATLFSGQALSFSPVVLVLDGMFSNYTGLPAAPFVNYTVWMFLVSILSGILWLLVGKFLMKIPSPDLKHVSLSQKQKLTRYQLYASIAALIFILGLIYASIFQDPVAVFLNMHYPARFEWQTRCEFNAYCKRTLRNELIDACRERKSRKRHEVSFADLTPQEEKQLYTVDRYFVNEDEEAFCAGGLKITAKLLAEALHSLPDEKRQAVLLYYFFDMTDVEIAELMKVPRSTVQYRRTSSFELLKRYLEERADEWDEL